ncbi:MAG TPA: dinitrogenase iron-molybdenum cofactor [Clostridia bacterium]|nr:dinitrogenase iron-molybdenum cofactor [Clostridia bacterium]
MKIAIATEGDYVAQHFGRCPMYTIADLSDGQVKRKTLVPNPGHEPGRLPRFLADLGVSCIIAGGMGPRAQSLFAEQNIQTIIGVAGPVDDVIRDYMLGELRAGESLCEHPHEDHGPNCDHHGL